VSNQKSESETWTQPNPYSSILHRYGGGGTFRKALHVGEAEPAVRVVYLVYCVSNNEFLIYITEVDYQQEWCSELSFRLTKIFNVSPEDKGSMFLRNVGIYLQTYAVLQT
jgi:hypothetical protein